ncbi:hypothetical protein EDD17DRAFT_1507957 [Pisolithus thermaeus]|nr:hypothetical protein EV401DRAFT_1883853 [Pisolithus croceorrhizus]KAI6162508.1 hypothetical protein EDD17DRAFT_1507957 [Pisolithus thermaeus]
MAACPCHVSLLSLYICQSAQRILGSDHLTRHEVSRHTDDVLSAITPFIISPHSHELRSQMGGVDIPPYPSAVSRHYGAVVKRCVQKGRSIGHPAGSEDFDHLKCDWQSGKDKTVPSLYTAGEAARVSVHGANRLGANSLLDIVILGCANANHIKETLTPNKSHKIPDKAGPGSIEFSDRIHSADGPKFMVSVHLDIQEVTQSEGLRCFRQDLR